jgi:excisionase family DNA binding protein
MSSLVDQHGPFLRVDEAARLLRVSRTSAYALARRWLESGGTEGLPAVRIGRSIRIPTIALQRLADLEVDVAIKPEPLALRDAG